MSAVKNEMYLAYQVMGRRPFVQAHRAMTSEIPASSALACVEPSSQAITVELGCVEYRIDSGAEEAIRLLHEFLPAWGSPLIDRRSFTIVCRYDDELLLQFARLLEAATVVSRSLHTFNSVPTIEWTIGSRYVYQQLVGESHFIIDDGAAKIAIAPQKCASHWHAMRIVREIYLREMLGDGHTMLHGAAVDYAGKGLLIVGGKGAGKTTVSSRLMSGGWSFVTNDRVLVGQSQGILAAYPYPLDVRAHLTGVDSRVANRLAVVNSRHAQQEPYVRTESKAVNTSAIPAKERFSVREWVEAHDANSRAWTHVSAVLLPRWVNTPNTLDLRRLKPAEAFRGLRSNAFLGTGNVFSDEAFGGRLPVREHMAGPAVSNAWLHKVGPSSLQVLRAAIRSCRRLASELPVYELSIGPRSPSDRHDVMPPRLADLLHKNTVGV